jgi:hypothetical protein
MTDEKKTARVINPHDKVFRKAYSDLENARSLLYHRLPDKVLKLVDLNTLEISKDSFIEKELADYYSDLLYKVSLTDGSQGFIYVLFEQTKAIMTGLCTSSCCNIWSRSGACISSSTKSHRTTCPL